MEPDQRSAAELARSERPPGRLARSEFASQYRDRVPGIVATITSLTGVLNLLVALMPRERHRLYQVHEFVPVALSTAAISVLAVSGSPGKSAHPP